MEEVSLSVTHSDAVSRIKCFPSQPPHSLSRSWCPPNRDWHDNCQRHRWKGLRHQHVRWQRNGMYRFTELCLTDANDLFKGMASVIVSEQ